MRRKPVWALTSALLFAAGCSGPAAQSARPQSRAWLDPVSGELRAPTDAESAVAASAQASSTRSAAALKVAPEVVVTRLPNGLTEYDLGEAGRIREQACVQPDGNVGACTGASAKQGAAASAPHTP